MPIRNLCVPKKGAFVQIPRTPPPPPPWLCTMLIILCHYGKLHYFTFHILVAGLQFIFALCFFIQILLLWACIFKSIDLDLRHLVGPMTMSSFYRSVV